MQDTVISGILADEMHRPHWTTQPRKADFFDLKGVVEALLDRFACRPWRVERFERMPLDPGQAAALVLDGVQVGVFGRLHPALNGVVGIDGDVFLFEIALNPLEAMVRPGYRRISAFPWVRRDLSIELPEGVTAGELLDLMGDTGGDTLIDLELFDVYDGEGVSEGFRSVSVRLTLGSDEATLDEATVERTLSDILKQVEERLGGHLRGQRR